MMTKERALEILDQATANLQTNRENHNAIVMALQFLSKLELPKQDLKEVKNGKSS